MPSFKNFANGGIDEGLSKESTSIRHKQVRDNSVGSRIEKVWATDFERCESRKDYEKYISKYGKYESNKYISQARAKIKSLEAKEKARIESEKEARRVVSTPKTGSLGTASRPNILQTCMNALFWVIIIGGVALYSYSRYKQNLNDSTTDVVINPQAVQEQHATHTHSEQTYEPENTVVEQEPEPHKAWFECRLCGTTGRCPLCFGDGRCGGCGGVGQIYSVFYGDEVGPGRMTDCGSCNGSGRCSLCEGSGFCSACEGRGWCESEYAF